MAYPFLNIVANNVYNFFCPNSPLPNELFFHHEVKKVAVNYIQIIYVRKTVFMSQLQDNKFEIAKNHALALSTGNRLQESIFFTLPFAYNKSCYT